MKIEKVLNEFYLKNGLPENGGAAKDTFQIKLGLINIPFPNPKFRKKLTYIHDLEHVLNNCNTSWKGEGFIAGWEVGTGFWKHFPINIFVFLAFGFSLWLHPKSVFKGFKKGLNSHGIIDLGLSRSDLMKMDFEQLVKITKKEQHTEMGLLQWAEFIFWSFVAQVILFFPVVVGALGLALFLDKL